MKYLPTLALVGVLAVGGCSPAPAQAGLKESCTALGVVLGDFGQVAPTVQRYADYVPKVRAISDAGDAASKAALQPLVVALEKGAQGDVMGALGAQAAATLTLMPQCAEAGAPLAAAPAPSPSATATASTLPVEDFHAAIAETKRACDGDTCMVEARVGVGYVGVDDLGKALVTVTISGGNAPETRSLMVNGDEVNTVEISAQVAKGDELTVSIDRVEQA